MTVLDYSKTQRILLIIDLHPLLLNPNPNPNYLSPILTSIKTLLTFPPLAHSLFSFKFFFSSLSPLRSSSTLLNLHLPTNSCNPNSISFNNPTETLISLSETFKLLGKLDNCDILDSKPRAELVSSSIAQVIHDYGWDLGGSDESTSGGSDLMGNIRSNLVVLFSPVCRSFSDLSDFMGGVGNDVLSDCDAFCEKFRGVFGYVKDAFVSRDIHFSWVDVKYETECSNQIDRPDEYERLLGLFKNGIRGLRWGFCLSDSIVLGSALVPFGLVYPMIGVSSNCCHSNGMHKNISGQLNLEILDVNGKPLSCKYCDLQLADVKAFHGQRPDRVLPMSEHGKTGADVFDQPGGIWERFGEGPVTIDVKAISRQNELMKMEGQISDMVLVHELSVESKKSKEETSMDFFADRVIDLLLKDNGKLVKRRSPPLWQILLGFLYRRDCWALVSVANPGGNSTMGVLKPITFDSAVLLILKGDAETLCGEINQGCGTSVDSGNEVVGSESKRKNKKHPQRYKDLCWSSFCKAAIENCEMELEEVYFSKGGDTSKKMNFLKCWMKQIVKNSLGFALKPDTSKVHSQDQEKVQQRLKQSHQECEQPLSLGEENGAKEPPQPQVEAADAFFNNLSERIQDGIASGVDLVAFSHRMVHSCIYWFNRRLGPDMNEGSQASVEKSDGSSCGGLVAGKLMKILLQDPKELTRKHKDINLSSQSFDAKLSKMSSGDIVREYELQILFRMEILQSEVAVGMRESTKHKFIKQICSLLESIQCSMEDGFFGDFNLTDYVSRLLSRYSQNLEGIIRRIYEQMDLLLFNDEEEESPITLLNSEDSSQSWRVDTNKNKESEPNSTDSFSGPLLRETGRCDDEDRKLVEAQERRERAKRLSSFTRKAMPELQRVWAPRPNKLSRSQSDSFCGSSIRSKRKSRHREKYDKVVCETPMSGAKKCLFPCSEEGDHGDGGSSVPRALLFQDGSLDLD